MEVGEIGFWVLSVMAITFALLMITRKSAVVSALMLVLTFCSLAGLYLTLSAQFLAVVQVAVYAGAIMVLVIFVIMLLNLQHEELQIRKSKRATIGLLAAGGILAQILAVIYRSQPWLSQPLSPNAAALGTTESVGMTLYTTYAFPFELASLILISAAVGAIILAKKRIA